MRRKRGDPRHMGHFGGPAHRTAVPPGNAVALIDKVEMRIDVDDMDRLLIRIGGNCRHGDGMVAAEDIGHGSRAKQGAHRRRGIGEAAFGVGVDDVAVAGIDNPHVFGGQIGHFILEVEDALRPETVEH